MVALPQIRCQLYDHARQYDNDGACHNKRNGGSCMVIYLGMAMEGYMVVLMHRRKLCGTREASNGGRMRVRIIHGLNISHKLTYLLQKSISYQNKVLRACS